VRRLRPWVPAVLYAGLVFWLSSQSNPLPFLPTEIWSFDKLLHAVEYAVLGLLLARALRAGGLSPGRTFLGALLLASLFGASDELHQAFVPNRSCDPRDWAADTAGAAAGAVLGARSLRPRRARASIRA
jgi:VanZ family protein